MDKEKLVLTIVAKGHFAKDKSCPAHGQTCRQCGEIGRFKSKTPNALRFHAAGSGQRRQSGKQDGSQHLKGKGSGFHNCCGKNSDVNKVSENGTDYM